MRWQLLQLSHAGARGGGDNDLDVGDPRFERLDQMRANVHLADAHRVHNSVLQFLECGRGQNDQRHLYRLVRL